MATSKTTKTTKATKTTKVAKTAGTKPPAAPKAIAKAASGKRAAIGPGDAVSAPGGLVKPLPPPRIKKVLPAKPAALKTRG